MNKRTATAGATKRPRAAAPTPARSAQPLSTGVTTRRDIEQSTYTSWRSKQLREGNSGS
jgi:hypothetical protein